MTQRYLHVVYERFQGITEQSILTARDAGDDQIIISADGRTLICAPLKDLEDKGIAWVSSEHSPNTIKLDDRLISDE